MLHPQVQPADKTRVDLTPQQVQELLATLEGLKKELEISIARTKKALSNPLPVDDRVSSNHPGDTFYVDLTPEQVQLQGAEVMLARVERAIAKLDEGTYGICDACKEPIPPERLQCQPGSIYCRPCQQKVDQSNKRH